MSHLRKATESGTTGSQTIQKPCLVPNLVRPTIVEISLRYWLDLYGDKSLSETANVKEQERFHNWLIQRKGLKPNSAARNVSNGKTAINWAWKRGEIDHKVREASTTEIYAPFDTTYLSQSKRAIDALFANSRVKDIFELISASR